MCAAAIGHMSAVETRQMYTISSGVVQEAEVCSLSIKSRFLEFIRRRPAESPDMVASIPKRTLPIHRSPPLNQSPSKEDLRRTPLLRSSLDPLD